MEYNLYQNLVSDTITLLNELPKSSWEPAYEKEICLFFESATTQSMPVATPSAPTVSTPAFAHSTPALTPIEPLYPKPKPVPLKVAHLLDEQPQPIVPSASQAAPKEEPSSQHANFKLQPIELKTIPDLTKARELMLEIAPRLTLHPEPLDDAKAKVKFQRPSLQVPHSQLVLIAECQNDAIKALLQNILKAIEGLGYTTHLLEAKAWEQQQYWARLQAAPIQRFLLALSTLEGYPLMRHYCRRDPSSNQPFFQNKPVLFMGDPQQYLVSPQQKVGLWKRIKAFLDN